MGRAAKKSRPPSLSAAAARIDVQLAGAMGHTPLAAACRGEVARLIAGSLARENADRQAWVEIEKSIDQRLARLEGAADTLGQRLARIEERLGLLEQPCAAIDKEQARILRESVDKLRAGAQLVEAAQ